MLYRQGESAENFLQEKVVVSCCNLFAGCLLFFPAQPTAKLKLQGEAALFLSWWLLNNRVLGFGPDELFAEAELQ